MVAGAPREHVAPGRLAWGCDRQPWTMRGEEQERDDLAGRGGTSLPPDALEPPEQIESPGSVGFVLLVTDAP